MRPSLGQVVHLLAGVEELRRGRVEGDGDVDARLVAGLLHGLQDHLDGVFVAGQVRREAALVAHGGGQTPAGQDLLERVEHLHAHAQTVAVAAGAHRHDHELLQVHVVVGVLAAVEDVHHRHRKHVRVGSAQVAVQGKAEGLRRRLGHRQGGSQDGVGAQPPLVRGPVGLDEQQVDLALVDGVHAHQRVGDLAVDVLHRLEDALAAPGLAPVAQFDRFEAARRGARRHRGPAHRPARELHLDLDRRVAARIQDLPSEHAEDNGHRFCSFFACW